jgi:methylenetetrahydrofolate dehydrogenase (NADP+)/methenyltetrahydrofolate cyclohydrolase
MGGALVIDGHAVAAGLRRRVTETAAALRRERGFVPGLAAVLVGDDPASHIYVRNKHRACRECGLASFEHVLPAATRESELLDLVRRLDADERVDGILVQLPLPEGLDPRRIVAAIDPVKDVDGFHPVNIGRLWSGEESLVPPTAQGCLILLRQVHDDLAGAQAVVLGRSTVIGRPVAALLLAHDCTVTIAHSKSRNAAALCRAADILIAAVGQPGLVRARWIKPGATVIDVGTTRIAQPEGGSRLVGDVEREAALAVAGAISPVPGGVGPMTIACLLRNTVLAACRRRGVADPPGLAI